MTAERYAALADWADSAATVTMSAITEARFERPWPAPGAESGRLPVSHVAPASATRVRRIRVAAVTGAALALLVGGVAFVRGGDDEPETPAAVSTAPLGAEAPVTDSPVADSRDPVPAGSAPASASPSVIVSPSASASVSSSPSLPSLDLGAVTRDPARSLSPESSGPAADPAVYTAFYGYRSDAASGYSGTVQVVNAGGSAGAGWAVSLIVPGGEKVILSGGDVRMSQSGSRVTFRPAGGAELAAGDSVTISFTIDGVPEELPTGCAINGTACA
jgi:hypothetical protein